MDELGLTDVRYPGPARLVHAWNSVSRSIVISGSPVLPSDQLSTSIEQLLQHLGMAHLVRLDLPVRSRHL